MHRGRALVLLSTRFRMDRPELLHMRAGHLMMPSENIQLTVASSLPLSGPSPRNFVLICMDASSTYFNTDSNPLMYLVTSAKLSATDHRWLPSLAAFDFSITYRAGKVHLASRPCPTAAVWVPNPYRMKSTSSPSWTG